MKLLLACVGWLQILVEVFILDREVLSRYEPCQGVYHRFILGWFLSCFEPPNQFIFA